MEKAVDTESVSDGDNDDIRVLRDEILAIVIRVVRPASLKTAAVYPHHNGLFLRTYFSSLPYV